MTPQPDIPFSTEAPKEEGHYLWRLNKDSQAYARTLLVDEGELQEDDGNNYHPIPIFGEWSFKLIPITQLDESKVIIQRLVDANGALLEGIEVKNKRIAELEKELFELNELYRKI